MKFPTNNLPPIPPIDLVTFETQNGAKKKFADKPSADPRCHAPVSHLQKHPWFRKRVEGCRLYYCATGMLLVAFCTILKRERFRIKCNGWG